MKSEIEWFTGIPEAVKVWNTRPDVNAAIYCDTDEYEVECIVWSVNGHRPTYNREARHLVMERAANRGFKISSMNVKDKIKKEWL